MVRRGSALKALGCFLALVLLAGLGIGTAMLMQSSMDVVHLEPAGGTAELDAVLARFAGSRQYLDLERRDDGLVTAHVHHEREPAHPARIARVHGLLWDEQPARLVRVSTPAWVLDVARWKASLATPLMDPLEKRLGLEVALPDLAPFGPGLVLDHHGAHGRRIVIWADGE